MNSYIILFIKIDSPLTAKFFSTPNECFFSRYNYYCHYIIPSETTTTITHHHASSAAKSPIMLDFKTKTRPCFTAAVNESKNPKFLAINHNAISFDKKTYQGNKKIPTRFTIIRPLAAGWAAAPYRQNQKSVGAKRLSDLTKGNTNGPVMRMFSFEKSSNNMEKGPRCDDVSFEIQTGNTFNFWLDEKRLGDDSLKRSINGIERIEALTVCEIMITSKNSEGAAKGSSCKITEIRPCSFTLHSCMEDVERFPSNLADARSLQLKVQQHQPLIARDLVPEEASFHIFASPKAFIQEEEHGVEDVVRLVNTGADPIDIPIPILLHYTNCTNKDWACSLLEMAIANNALQLFVLNNDFWKNATHSALRAVPLINTDILLQSIVPSLVGTQSDFVTPNTTTIDDITYNIQIRIDQEPTQIATGVPPTAPDFILTGKAIELERAYKIHFNLVAHEDEIPNYWLGYYDASPQRTVASVMSKRRRPTPCGEEEED